MGMGRKAASTRLAFDSRNSAGGHIACQKSSKRGVVPAVPASRFEILNDGPRRWVLVDNHSDDRFCMVYPSRAKAKAAIANYV